MSGTNRQVILKTTPTGVPATDHFSVIDGAAPVAGEGEVLVENLYLSLDPYMRSQITGRHLSGAVNPGDLMKGETVSRVLTSRADDFAAGDLVIGFGGWQQQAALPAAALRKLPDLDVSPSVFLGPLGMPGLTAYASVLHLSTIKPGDMAVVSAASGAVGSMWGQLARISGARVVGIVGSEEKADYIVNELGFEAAVNYKTCDLKDGLKAACAQGIDVYHDNVGGDVLEAVMVNLAPGAEIVLCGMMKQYNSSVPLPGPGLGPLFAARATMRAIVVYDHEDKRQKFQADVARWIGEGRIKYREQMVEGIDQAPDLFCTLMSGDNFGKCIVKIAD